MDSCKADAEYFTERFFCNPADNRQAIGLVLHNLETNELKESKKANGIALADYIGKNVLIQYG